MASNAPVANSDPWAGFADFVQRTFQMAPPTAEQIAALSAYAPMMGMYQQLQSGDLQSQANEIALQKLKYDFNLSEEQLAQARKEFEFQSGKYWDYQMLKTGNDMQISNNDVLNSKNQIATSQEYTKQAKNQALGSAYQAMMAEDQQKAAHYNYLVQTGQAVGQSPRNSGSFDILGY